MINFLSIHYFRVESLLIFPDLNIAFVFDHNLHFAELKTWKADRQKIDNNYSSLVKLKITWISTMLFYKTHSYLRRWNSSSDSEVCCFSLSRLFRWRRCPIVLGKHSIESIVDGKIILNFRWSLQLLGLVKRNNILLASPINATNKIKFEFFLSFHAKVKCFLMNSVIML